MWLHLWGLFLDTSLTLQKNIFTIILPISHKLPLNISSHFRKTKNLDFFLQKRNLVSLSLSFTSFLFIFPFFFNILFPFKFFHNFKHSITDDTLTSPPSLHYNHHINLPSLAKFITSDFVPTNSLKLQISTTTPISSHNPSTTTTNCVSPSFDSHPFSIRTSTTTNKTPLCLR